MTRWWWRIAQPALAFWPTFAGLGVILLTLVGLELLLPWPVKLAIDHVLVGEPLPGSWRWLGVLPGTQTAVGLLVALGAALLLIFLGHRLAEMARAWVEAGAGARLATALGERVFDHLQRRSLAYHGRHATGDLVRRATEDATCSRDLVMGAAVPLAMSLLTLGGIFGVVWTIDWVMALLAMAAAVPIGLAIALLARPMSERSYEHQQAEGRLLAMAERTMTAVPLIQAFSRENHEHRAYRGLTGSATSAYLRSIAAQLYFKGTVDSAIGLGTAALMLVGGLRAAGGHVTIGDLYLFLSYVTALYAPLATIAYLAAGVANARGKAQRVLEVLDAEPDLQEPADPHPLPPAAQRLGRLAFENVTVGYEPDRPVLRRLNLVIEPGETVALVGPSGVGKSTLVSLVPRFLDPWSGTITLDGVDHRRLRLKDLRSQIAWLPQEPLLMPGTIARNIAYGRPDATREAVEDAARAAAAHDFILGFPQGYDTVVGERGATLSGGQAQRVAIARAFLIDAPVLILDEPTSALDAETETQVMLALERLARGRTTLVIAHRLSTIRKADRILVLQDGGIGESGTHDQLMRLDGAYARFTRAGLVPPGEADRAL